MASDAASPPRTRCDPARGVGRTRRDAHSCRTPTLLAAAADLSQQLALIALAYRPFGRACCGTGKRPASLTSLLSDPQIQRGNRMSYDESDPTGHGAVRTVDPPDDVPRDSVDEWGAF